MSEAKPGNQHPRWGRITAAICSVILGLAFTRPATAAGHPGVMTLLQRSRVAMGAVHQTHVVGKASNSSTSFGSNGGPSHTSVHVVGDCDLTQQGSLVALSTQDHVWGSTTGGTRGDQSIDERYISIVKGKKNATSSADVKMRLWTRSARTQNRWRKASPASVVNLPGYYLGNSVLCPNERAGTLITPDHFTYVGTRTLDGAAVWHIHGRETHGDTTDLHLYIDQKTYRWVRFSLTLTLRNNGVVVNRLPSTGDYSRFNQPTTIKPPTVGASQP